MKVVESVTELRTELSSFRSNQKSLALVPTMGALHSGHLSLVDTARSVSDLVAMSIFVNPLQFNNKEDLKKYPAKLENDLALAKKSGVNLVFTPSPKEIYPTEVTTSVKAGSMSNGLCGAGRPGHFDGVVTVVSILFNLFQPDTAIFGEKDFQQLKVIEQLNQDLHFGIKIVPSPLVREENGLALSSRNARLTPTQKEEASQLYKALKNAKDLFKSGENNPTKLKETVTTALKDTTLNLEYFEALNESTLENDTSITPKHRLFAAAAIEDIRLIDNLPLT